MNALRRFLNGPGAAVVGCMFLGWVFFAGCSHSSRPMPQAPPPPVEEPASAPVEPTVGGEPAQAGAVSGRIRDEQADPDRADSAQTAGRPFEEPRIPPAAGDSPDSAAPQPGTAVSAGGETLPLSTTDPAVPRGVLSDPVTDLDRSLDRSLEGFDKSLLEERERMAAESRRRPATPEDAAASAKARLKAQGIDLDSKDGDREDGETSGSGEGASGSTAPGEQERDGDGESVSGGPGRVDNGRSGGPGRAGTGDPTPPERDGDGSDDDIVARQLREAAENETDPEIKKKLWKEYEEYKRNQL